MCCNLVQMGIVYLLCFVDKDRKEAHHAAVEELDQDQLNALIRSWSAQATAVIWFVWLTNSGAFSLAR